VNDIGQTPYLLTKPGRMSNKTKKKGRKKIRRNKVKKTKLSIVINVATDLKKTKTIRHYECNSS